MEVVKYIRGLVELVKYSRELVELGNYIRGLDELMKYIPVKLFRGVMQHFRHFSQVL